MIKSSPYLLYLDYHTDNTLEGHDYHCYRTLLCDCPPTIPKIITNNFFKSFLLLSLPYSVLSLQAVEEAGGEVHNVIDTDSVVLRLDILQIT